MSAALHRIVAELASRPLLVLPAYAETLLAVIGERGGIDTSKLSAGDFAARQPTAESGAGVAHVPIIGSLTHRGSALDAQSGLTSYAEIGRKIDAALADSYVGTILLEFDTPGGSVSGAFDLADKINAASKIKPVIAFVDGMCCSAGYLLASQCTTIVATQTSMVGSIGVISMHLDRSMQIAAQGVRPTFIIAGAHKADGTSALPLPADVRARMQSQIDEAYDMFVSAVGRGRGDRFTAGAARATEATIYTAKNALALGLIDKMGTMPQGSGSASGVRSDAVAAAKAYANAKYGRIESSSTTGRLSPSQGIPRREATLPTPGDVNPEAVAAAKAYGEAMRAARRR
jgi:signal peptide peptidase SppA